MTRLSTRLFAFTAVLVLGTAACSSDSESSPDSTATAITTTDDTTGASTPAASSGGSVADGDQRAAIVDFTIAQAAEGGIELDPDCIAGIVDQLSDADTAELAASVADPTAGGPALSAEGEALGERISDDCINGSDDQALIDEVIDRVLAESGDSIDEACVRENVPKLTDDQLHLILDTETGSTGPESTDPRLQTAAVFLLDCVEFPSSTTG